MLAVRAIAPSAGEVSGVTGESAVGIGSLETGAPSPPAPVDPEVAQDVAKREKPNRTTVNVLHNSEPLIGAATPHSIERSAIRLPGRTFCYRS